MLKSLQIRPEIRKSFVFLGGGTLLSFAASLAENWGGLGRVETTKKPKFIPNLMIN